MKKITLIAALLGSVYFANAQVGIGTADPSTSAELDIVAKSGKKGILIPRVELKNTTEFQMTGKSAESTSLLVFNKTEVKDLVPTGFYYWDGTKWNRIVGKEELDTVIKNLGDNITNITTKLEGDVKNLQAVVNYILPSNPDNTDDKGNPVVTEKHTTIVYNPETKEMFYVTYEGGKYTTEKIDLTKMVQGVETNTFFKEIKDASGKVTGYVYFNESTIVKAIGTETDAAKIKDIISKLDENTPGAINIDVKGTVVNNIQEILKSTTSITEGGKTFTTVEQYLQYISQSAEGNVIYTNLGDDTNPNWVFQYYNKVKGEYVTINLRDLVADTESKTTIVTYDNKQYYLSEAYIVGGGELDVTKWTTVPAGAIHVDVVGGVINNIEEILTTKGNIKITVGGKEMTFTSVEEYLQYITQFSEGNVIYKNISTDPKKEEWVLQYWDGSKYETINLTDLVASVETKTNILRSESKTNGTLETYAAIAAPVEANVKVGEIFYKYNNEDKGEQFINMTADIISSIKNNEEVKNEITNVLNQGGNVYFGDHDDNAATDEVFYKIVGGTRVKIELPVSFMLDIINKYKDVIKNALGDHINNNTTIVNTGNTYNGKMVFLAKGTTIIGKVEGTEQYPSPLTTGTTIDLSKITGLTTIEDVLSISILKAGKVVASSVTDLVITGNKLEFAIGTGSFYTSLPYGDYEVVIEFTGNLAPMTPIVSQP